MKVHRTILHTMVALAAQEQRGSIDVTQSISTGSHKRGLALFALARYYHLMVEIPSIQMNTNLISVLMTNVNILDTTDEAEAR